MVEAVVRDKRRILPCVTYLQGEYGLDGIFIQHRAPLPQMPTLQEGIPDLMRLPSEQLFASLETKLDSAPGSLNKGDDVSIVMLDVDEPVS